jgi:hypothetical protein
VLLNVKINSLKNLGAAFLVILTPEVKALDQPHEMDVDWLEHNVSLVAETAFLVDLLCTNATIHSTLTFWTLLRVHVWCHH